ncbi:TIGR02450 family Trp-rich protein [Undibacterium amnicola]|uniref:TIGR02450 family Trp-rich protein n=1 Tax=Undibacterium amnicola TaxID=1834038 RepID=A0ABR6XKQ8_9BURK|nr:TIGR02450 family Trp-rich protein [Undibacterium amnicola]
MIKLNPKKLLLTKWTAVEIVAKQKHFLVSRIVQPDDLNAPIIEIEIEAVYSGNKRIILWRELQDSSRWKQGWV